MHLIDIHVTRSRLTARNRILALPMVLGLLTLGGCAPELVTPSGVFVLGEEHYAELNDAQREAFNTVRQEFSDPIEYPTFILVRWTRALYPELFTNKVPNPNTLEEIAEARQRKIAAALTTASQTAISSQMTLNAPSQDASANPTALDSRRSETANGHPSY